MLWVFIIPPTLLLVFIMANWSGSAEKNVDYRLRCRFSVESQQFRRFLGALLGPPLVNGNHVTVLVNGAEYFPAMLHAIKEARQTIHFETYVFWNGRIARQFTDALIERARDGVQVRLMYDWAGSRQVHGLIQEMRAVGIQVQAYHAPSRKNFKRMNNRTHRKVLVVDGRIGFTGGAGIADEWSGNADSTTHWRDTHYQVTGPVVTQMQAAFLDNWMKTTGEVIFGDAFFPEQESTGSEVAQMFTSSSREDNEHMRLMYLLCINCARHTILLESAYFVPDDLTIRMFVEALRRGVKVRIIVPGKLINKYMVREASRSLWREMLEAGAEIYEYQPTMFHCKVIIVDDYWVSVGSTNFDNRSFRLNDEANLNIMSRAFARHHTEIFEQDRCQSDQITLADWHQRTLPEKVIGRLAAMLRFQL